MRWIVFAVMIVITPVAFGGDLTPARLYLQRSATPQTAEAKPWRVGRGAIYGACFGIALNVGGTLLAPPSPPLDFLIQTAALSATAALFAGVGAGVAQLRNWIARSK